MGICEKHEHDYPNNMTEIMECDDCTCDVCGDPIHLCNCMDYGILD